MASKWGGENNFRICWVKLCFESFEKPKSENADFKDGVRRISKALTNSKAKALTEPGRYSDEDSLYLSVAKGGSKSWTYMWKKAGRRRGMGLGGYPLVTLALACRRAQEAREMVRDGLDPFDARKKTRSGLEILDS